MAGNTNKELARIFNEMGELYALRGPDDRFRALAYRKAARVIANLQEDISGYTMPQLDNIKGVGESIAEKIKEYVSTGHVAKYEELCSILPYGLIELLDIQGFGPETLKKIHSELNISTREELIRALEDGSIAKLKGFGEKKVDKMRKGLKLHKQVEERLTLWMALNMARPLLEKLRALEYVKAAELAGSLRRRRETIGDIDILVSTANKDRKKLVGAFTSLPEVMEILAKGDTKASIVLKEHLRQVDLRVIDPDEWGAALQYFTGSKDHNIHLRNIAKDKGLKISEYGVFRIQDGKRIASLREDDIYGALDMQCMPPEMREDRGEIELAARHDIPTLISLDDIKGDMQMHSKWTDGMYSIEEIALYVRQAYPHWEYIVITDHSKAVRIAHGMDEKKFLKQLKEIEQINQKLGLPFVKAGVEVDINADGSLDLSDELLSRLDWVTASIHTGLNRDNTDRLIKACENPYVNAIGHPMGRLMGARAAYPVDVPALLEAALATGTALEINAQPERMDLNDEMAYLAREKGVKLLIATDSHQVAEYRFIELGVSIARRAWCRREDILNTQAWDVTQSFVSEKRKVHATV